MEKILARALAELEQGRPCLLATVIESTGSTPRSAGAYMLVGAEGRLAGTVGGGSIEYAAIKKGQQQLAQGENFLFTYTLTMEAAADLGMVCGGSCKILYSYLKSEASTIATLRQALKQARAGQAYWLLLPLGQGQVQLKDTLPLQGHRGRVNLQQQEYFAEEFAYDGRVYIFGGGHLAQELVPVLARLSFRCIVLEDREDFAKKELFPEAEAVGLVDFNNLSLNISEQDYVAIMTRGHQNDAQVERYALTTAASYIGVVGSRRKAALTRATLAAEGFSQQQLDRIITPIGIPMASETPAEIAISIAAQLINHRASKGKNIKI